MKADVTAKDVRLTQIAKHAGCAAKLAPGFLGEILKGLPKNTDPRLLVGTETSDDAAVYKLTEDIAIVQTIDFFTPVVDDPYTFGQIAAANALSDVYAMGAVPITALNVVAYPNCLGTEVLAEILRGGADKVQEAGASLAGGHSINDDEPKYGLSVTGIVHPDRILKNFGARENDVLIITKPLGCGLVNTAVKAEMASPKASQMAIKSMSTLNKYSAEIFSKYQIHACTDVTGFGLIGHAMEMAKGSDVTLEIDTNSLPIIEEALDYAKMGLVPMGSYLNREYTQSDVDFGTIAEEYIDLVCDPQTSGGLLISVCQSEAEGILNELTNAKRGLDFGMIGRVLAKKNRYILFK